MARLRVLHLIDPQTPGGGPCTLRMLSDVIAGLPDMQHDVVLLGTRFDIQCAEQCGVTVDDATCPPTFQSLAGRRQLSALLQRRIRRLGDYHVIHGWTVRAALVASLAMPRHPRLATLNAGPPPAIAARALRSLLQQHSMPLLAASNAIQRAYVYAGAPGRRMMVLPPPVDADRIDLQQRAKARSRWGIDDHTFVIGALCEPFDVADAQQAMRAIAAIHLTGRRVKMVIHEQAYRRTTARRWGRSIDLEPVLIFDERAARPWEMAPGLDAVWIVAAQRPGSVHPSSPLPMLWMMAAGLPVVAEADDSAPEILRDQANALVIARGDVGAICDRIAQLYDDRALGSRLGSAAKAYVDEHSDVAAYAERLGRLYQQIAASRGH